MYWRERSSTATAWGITARSLPGDVQWMTAGSGIIHQEMPKGDEAGRMHGFQLWANLPASLKMTAPRYQEVKSPDIPEVTDDDGTQRAHRLRKFLGEEGAGGWNCGRSDLSGCVGAAGTEEEVCRWRRRVTRSLTFSRGPGSSAMRPGRWRCRRKGWVAGYDTSDRGGQSFAGAVRSRR